jgi:hypothetical protein
VIGPRPRVLGEDGLRLVPGRTVDNGVVLAGITRSFVHGIAEVGAIAEDLVDRALVDGLARAVLTVLRDPGLGRTASTPKLLR